MRKKDRQRFVKQVREMLLEMGAEQKDEYLVLQTKAGALTLHPTENLTEGLGTVFTRFDNPQAARQLVDCNPYSGKWNHHYFKGWSVESAVEDLFIQLTKVRG